MRFVNKNFFSSIKEKLIHESLKNITKYGWTERSILAGCQQLNLSPASHKIISPYNLITYSMNKWNQQALRIVDDTNFGEKKRIRQKIHFSIKQRLQKQIPFIDTWHQAMKVGAYPQNILQTKNLLWYYSDQIWHRCGDKSTDYNYYTKRILFNSVYASTELFLLTDQTQNKEASWEFLQRRLDNIEQLGINIKNTKVVLSALSDGVCSIFGMLNRAPQATEHPISQYKQQLNKQLNKQSQQLGQNIQDEKQVDQNEVK